MFSRNGKRVIRNSNLSPRDCCPKRRVNLSRSRFIERRLRKTRISLAIFFCLIVIILAIYFLLSSDHFQIKNKDINKIGDYGLMSEQELEEKINVFIGEKKFLFPMDNLLTVKIKSLKKYLATDKRIELLEITKIFPSTLLVNFKETKPEAILLTADNNKNYLDCDGQIIYSYSKDTVLNEKNPNDSDFTTQESFLWELPILNDKTNALINDQNYRDFLKNLLGFIENDVWTKNGIKVNFVELAEQGGIFEAQVITQAGWRAIINSEVNLEKQINNLDDILKNRKEEFNNLDYIILKFGKEVVLKYKNTE